MGYRETQWPKIVFGTIAFGLLAFVFGAPFWHPFKERYFNYVAASCSETHGLEDIAWQEVPAFDAEVRRFVAKTAKERAALDCINRWAGVVITYEASDTSSPYPGIESSVGGSHYAPPQRLVSYGHVQPPD